MVSSRDLCFSELRISPTSSSSSTITNSEKPYFDNLPDDLFVVILKRVRQDLVHRYRCVSKRWLNITSTDSFIKCHIEYNSGLSDLKTPPFGLLYEQIGHDTWRFDFAYSENSLFDLAGFSLDFLPLPLPSPDIPLYLLSWNNGLLLCSSYKERLYYVCNPLTKQWVTPLPRPSTYGQTDTGFVCRFTSSGFTFRVVHITYRGKFNRNLEIYDSETREWTEVTLNKRFMFDPEYAPRNEAVTCNGLIHWKNNTGSIFVYDPYNDGENCKIISVPHKMFPLPERYSNVNHTSIGVCKEQFRYLEWGEKGFVTWELEDYDNEKWRLVQECWVNQMDIENPMISSNFFFISAVIHPFDEDVVFLQRENVIVRCNTRLRKMEIVGNIKGSVQCYKFPTRWFPITLPWWPVSLPLH